MAKGIKLSNSKVQRYLRCPKSYELHYEKRIRSRIFGSPLFFGLALDEAINRLLLEKKKGHDEIDKEAKKLTVLETFDFHMKNGNVNGNPIQIPQYRHLQFGKADYDSSLLEESDFLEIGEDKNYCDTFIEWYHTEKKKWSKSEITGKDTDIFNKINWHSLYRKGLMILEVYEKDIMPEIHEVFEIQKAISLPNANGDEIIGFIDFICSFVDAPTTKVIVDNKSSSKPYKQVDLDESDQLCTYSEAENIPDISYIVYEKNIRKRDPRVRITIWRGKASETHIDKVFDNYKQVLSDIKDKNFPKDTSSKCFFFGRPCEFYSICHKDKMGDDLVVLKKSSKK